MFIKRILLKIGTEFGYEKRRNGVDLGKGKQRMGFLGVIAENFNFWINLLKFS